MINITSVDFNNHAFCSVLKNLLDIFKLFKKKTGIKNLLKYFIVNVIFYKLCLQALMTLWCFWLNSALQLVSNFSTGLQQSM